MIEPDVEAPGFIDGGWFFSPCIMLSVLRMVGDGQVEGCVSLLGLRRILSVGEEKRCQGVGALVCGFEFFR